MSLVTRHTEAGICTLAFNRADKLNALNREMYRLLSEGFDAANDDDNCRVVLLQGTEGIFTAGNDLADFAQAAQQGQRFSEPFQLMKAMLGVDKPIVASVDGPAIGIGTTLLFHCDLICASHSARFHTPFTDLGVCAEFAASETFPALLGHQRAAQMLLLGEPLSAVDAERFGLLNKLVDTTELDATVNEMTARLAAKPQDSLRTTRRLLAARKSQYQAIIEREGEQFARLMQTDEFNDNLQNFLNKSQR